jgi:ribosomal 50S subunit-associated protein YjgA (DUF615 family)
MRPGASDANDERNLPRLLKLAPESDECDLPRLIQRAACERMIRHGPSTLRKCFEKLIVVHDERKS